MSPTKKNLIKLSQSFWGPFILIISATYFIWHKSLDQMLLGEGYYYFPRQETFFSSSRIVNNIWGADTFAKIIFDILLPIFKDNIFDYQLFQLLTQIIIYLSIYLVIKKITNSKLIALTATVFFLANFIGSFDMFGIGNYQRFIQRIPNFIPWIFSFYFLVEFFNSKKYKFYLISLVLFGVAVFMAHYSTFLLPIFLIYCLIWCVDQKPKLNAIFKSILLSIPYILINLFFIQKDSFKPSVSILDFILHEDHFIEHLLYQLPINTFPSALILKLQQLHIPSDKLSIVLGSLVIPAILFYLIGLVLTTKNNPALIKLYLTTFFFALSVMFLNIYIGKVNALVDFGTDRYYLIPSLALSINWAIILNSIFKKHLKVYAVNSLLITTFYLAYNYSLINYNFDLIQYKSNNMRLYVNYIKTLSSQFNNHTVIVTQPFLLWPDGMFETIYNSNLRSIPFDTDWEKKIDSKYTNDVFVIDFDYKSDDQIGKVVDLTEKYRSGEKIDYIKY